MIEVNVTGKPKTAIARICERWTMEIELPHEAGPKWFLNYALENTKDAGKHLTAGWLAYVSLASVWGEGDIVTAHECFGGMGAQSLMIDEMFHPSSHTIGEWSPTGVRHLQRVLPDKGVVRFDAYADKPPVADLYGLDFGDLTAWRTKAGDSHRRLLDQVFGNEPKAVVFTDIACRYLHLHRARYESLLGKDTCASYPMYLRALLARFEALYGYCLVRGYWDRWSAVMALVPVDLKASVPGELIPTPKAPVGLEIF